MAEGFDGEIPDDGWLDDAPVELSAEERIAEAQRRRRQDALQQRLIDETEAQQREERTTRRQERRRTIGSASKGILILAFFAGLAVFLANRDDSGGDSSSSTVIGGDGIVGGLVDPSQLPTPTPPDSRSPLGEPPPIPTGSGDYEFVRMQDDRDAATAYDPCREIHYVTNLADAPSDAGDLIESAIAEISAATGLVFVDDGSTDEPFQQNRPPFQPDRYGDQWAPLGIWWATPQEAPDLQGDVAGFAGSWSIQAEDTTGGRSNVYVSGTMVLDGPTLEEMLRAGGGREIAYAVILHELGHVVGLDHVEDPAQIMTTSNLGTTELGDGDRRGLAELGRGRCFPQL